MLPRGAIVSRPPRIVVKGHRLAVAMLGPHGRKTLNYQLHFAMRGYYQVGPLVLETGDLFGLHRRFRIVTEPVYIMVYPKVVPLPGYDLASRRPIGEIRLTHRLFEDPTRIAGVRYYQPGDPLNRVTGRATARTGVLHSKVYDASTIAGATIVLDFHRDSYPARNEPGRSELAVTTARGAGQRGVPDGPADRPDHQRPRRRRPDPPSRRDRPARGRAAGRSRGRPPDGRDARGRRPAPSADRPAPAAVPRVFARIREVHGPRRADRRPDVRPALDRGRAAAAPRRHGRRGAGERHARDGRGAGPAQAAGIRRQRRAPGLRRGRADRLRRAADRRGPSRPRGVR